ncbi:MAG TPA: fimbria/pilus periplasmic chaperone [Steroidobacteraceae bacterium]|nr:fimbria/pilus periplasmic chaperone [Steroidobacteraceae bacterium]
MRALGATLLAMGVLAAAATAAASALSVAPIRVHLSSKERTAVLTVRNQEDSPVVVQVRPTAWSQPEGQDQLDDTHELLVTPPIFTIPPKGLQVLRIALLREPDPARELPYRLVLSEIPPEVPAETTGLRVALRITLPVFVAARAKSAPELAWRHRWLPDGTLEIEASNHGTAHLQITDFDVAGSTSATPADLHAGNSHYLLPGAAARWQLHPGSDLARGSQPLTLHGHSDAGDFTVTSSPGAP